MKSSKIAFWALALVVLGSYTYGVMAVGTGNASYAYAQAISDNSEISRSARFIEVAADEQHNQALQNVIDRLKLRANEERSLCTISENDAIAIRDSGNAVEQRLELDNGEIARVLVSDDLTEKDIRNLNPSSNCIRLNVFERIILTLSSQVS